MHHATTSFRAAFGGRLCRTAGFAALFLALAAPALANVAPTAAADSYVTPESTPLTVLAPGVLANDADSDGDPLTARVVTPPAHGTVNLYADGSFNYVSAAYYVGPDSFTYVANDGTSDSAPATVDITVTPVNFPPVSFDDSYHGFNEGTLTVDAPGVLSNDTDPDGDAITARVVTPPAHGTVSLHADGSFAYASAAGFVGTDYFTYVAHDGFLDSAPSTVAVTVVEAGHASGSFGPVEAYVAFLPAATCTADRNVRIVLHAHNASAYMVSEDPGFAGANWQTRNDQIEPIVLDIAFPEGDGTKTAFAKFRSPGGVISQTVTASILLDQAGGCASHSPPPVAIDRCSADFASVDFHPYLVLADGREVHDDDTLVTFAQLNPAWREFNFANPVKGASGVFTVRLENLGTKVVLHTSGIGGELPAMRVRMRVHDRDRIIDDVLLWDDAKAAIGQTRTYDVLDSLARCQSGTSDALKPGDLLKGKGDAVYFLGKDGKRHVFPDRVTYDTWYADFSGVRSVTDEELSAIPLGANVRLRPGTKLVKIVSDPKVYALASDSSLRWVHDEGVAKALFGAAWAKEVVDVDPALLPGYGTGEDIVSPDDYVAPTSQEIEY